MNNSVSFGELKKLTPYPIHYLTKKSTNIILENKYEACIKLKQKYQLDKLRNYSSNNRTQNYFIREKIKTTNVNLPMFTKG